MARCAVISMTQMSVGFFFNFCSGSTSVLYEFGDALTSHSSCEISPHLPPRSSIIKTLPSL